MVYDQSLQQQCVHCDYQYIRVRCPVEVASALQIWRDVNEHCDVLAGGDFTMRADIRGCVTDQLIGTRPAPEKHIRCRTTDVLIDDMSPGALWLSLIKNVLSCPGK
jgi:hypothetical protein